jgi:hypothetical protein
VSSTDTEREREREREREDGEKPENRWRKSKYMKT